MYRVQKVSKIIQSSMEEVFRKLRGDFLNTTIVTVAHVDLSPNLGNANIYLSFISHKDSTELLKEVKSKTNEIRYHLAAKVKNKMRRVPEIHFFIDTTTENAYKLEKILKAINI
jgi:ribosome-binding factor A